ncbi:MAG: hypothetical protein JJE02_04450 [Propionibacteriales bacterium]|nr:hypothetical protein [Propionibacteriales bacterium]
MADRDASKEDLKHLKEFVTSRKGVEAYVEPKTNVTQATVLLVAHDGEWTRRRVVSAEGANDLARKLQIPCYDANRVGYPKRMREYNLRQSKG